MPNKPSPTLQSVNILTNARLIPNRGYSYCFDSLACERAYGEAALLNWLDEYLRSYSGELARFFLDIHCTNIQFAHFLPEILSADAKQVGGFRDAAAAFIKHAANVIAFADL